MAEILTDRDESEPIATVTISNPERRNAVAHTSMEDLAAAVRELGAEDDVRCLVLTGEGEAFCAGADLGSAADAPTAERIDEGFHAAVRELLTCNVPVVAKVQGPAVGAGASIAAACDLVYAGESARIGFSFTKIGLTADSGATFVLPQLVGLQKAKELLLTGDILDAEEAAEVGLFTEVVADEDLDGYVRDRATEFANGPTEAYGAVRRLLLRANENSMEGQLELESREQARMFHTSDAMEGISAFVADRDPEFEGQ